MMVAKPSALPLTIFILLLTRFANALRLRDAGMRSMDAPGSLRSGLAVGSSGVGSLPPMGLVQSKPASEGMIHYEMLPSQTNIVAHQAQKGETRPFLRASCASKLEQIKTSGSIKNRQSMTFKSFFALAKILEMPFGKNQTNANEEYKKDKGIMKALDNIVASQGMPRGALDWQYVHGLRNCAVDDMGRTILMELVRRGYSQSLDKTYATQLSSIPYYELKDTDNNNLLHLATMSKNVVIVKGVLSLMPPEQAFKALKTPNIHGMRPLDIANSLALEDVSQKLKTAFSVLETTEDGSLDELLGDLLPSENDDSQNSDEDSQTPQAPPPAFSLATAEDGPAIIKSSVAPVNFLGSTGAAEGA